MRRSNESDEVKQQSMAGGRRAEANTWVRQYATWVCWVPPCSVVTGTLALEILALAGSFQRAIPHGPSGPYPSVLFGSLNEVPGVTTCCSALLDWLPRSLGIGTQLASDCIKLPKSCESPVASKCGATLTKSESEKRLEEGHPALQEGGKSAGTGGDGV